MRRNRISKTKNSGEMILLFFLLSTNLYQQVTNNQRMLKMLAFEFHADFVQQKLKDIEFKQTKSRFVEIQLADKYEEISVNEIDDDIVWTYFDGE
jgi:hypothetical protein